MSKHISLASYELETAARADGYAHVCGGLYFLPPGETLP